MPLCKTTTTTKIISCKTIQKSMRQSSAMQVMYVCRQHMWICREVGSTTRDYQVMHVGGEDIGQWKLVQVGSNRSIEGIGTQWRSVSYPPIIHPFIVLGWMFAHFGPCPAPCASFQTNLRPRTKLLALKGLKYHLDTHICR